MLEKARSWILCQYSMAKSKHQAALRAAFPGSSRVTFRLLEELRGRANSLEREIRRWREEHFG